ncbi:MAG: 16S rRNA (adenine(1518)-N(6)/adenine(1519)-N(6))-dimethyltransferase RsmA [Candidatus Eutrophobiaceae bacterium]
MPVSAGCPKPFQKKSPKKSLGQHFLIDPMVISTILSLFNPQRDEFILEIGSGAGALSVPLAAYPVHLHTVELDSELAAALAARELGITVHCANVLNFDLRALPAQRIRVIGNLPYNIGAQILFHLADFRQLISDMLLMLQREVAERACAPEGTRARGRLSVMCQTFFDVQECLHIPPEAFQPPPKVQSTLLELRPAMRWTAQIADLGHYAELVRVAFSQPRKILRNTLRSHCSPQAMEQVSIDPGARPAELGIGQFIRLSNCLAH